MTQRHKVRGIGTAARPLVALALMLALAAVDNVPVRAQENPAPAPSSTPSISRPLDRLPPAGDGRTSGVQGPSDNGLPPLAPGERAGVPPSAPAPRPVTPQVVPTQPETSPATQAPAPARTQAPASAAPASRPETGSASPATATIVPPQSSESEALTLPPLSAEQDSPVASVAAAEEDSAPVTAATSEQGGTPLWAWLLAVLAALGAGAWYWRRRPALAGDAAPLETETPLPAPRAAPPAPQPLQPTPPTPEPQPTAPRPYAPGAMPMPSPLVTRPAPERRALVTMTLEVRGIRITADQIVVAFALDLENRGSATATGLMVRIALGQGSAMPEPVLARFFDGAGGSVLRDDIELAPGAREQLATDVMLPRTAADPLMIGGKPMLVPVLAFDVTYHWDGEGEAFGQVADSFVLGNDSGAGGTGKLAPLPLDRPSLTVARPAARATAVRRSQ